MAKIKAHHDYNTALYKNSRYMENLKQWRKKNDKKHCQKCKKRFAKRDTHHFLCNNCYNVWQREKIKKLKGDIDG